MISADYELNHVGKQFPLIEFSEQVYQMRSDGKVALTGNEFVPELQCMEHHKIVVSRQPIDANSSIIKEWHFRHEKIMEFFIVQTFLGADNDRPIKHLGTPRFRGVYFLLAMLHPLEDAQALREHLIQYASDTKDHTVSDIFVQLLRSRKSA